MRLDAEQVAPPPHYDDTRPAVWGTCLIVARSVGHLLANAAEHVGQYVKRRGGLEALLDAPDTVLRVAVLVGELEQIAKHGLVDLTVRAEGDVEIDGHHFVDGALKKTLHASEALDDGMDLVLCVNPIVPCVCAK